MVATWLVVLAGVATVDPLPTMTVTADDTPITQSCRVVVPPGVVLTDADGDGVLHVAASDITLEFASDAVLRGAAPGTPPDRYEGFAIRVDARRNVTIRGGRISGYRGAVWATGADGLTITDLDASDNRRARLRSTPQAEDVVDWLYPHYNDENQWLTNYAAALYIEDATRVTVARCRVRNGQNALCLDRVVDGRVYDNDFSFNSGWGIALWRSSRNVISRNACDFCIRGYSHGVFNRGQDSAGLLLFEQCSDNVIVENSATHGGDGLFGYAGREATRRAEATSQPSAPGGPPAGCNGNLIAGNDFSYAAAHGIEMTFSFGNRYLGNRLVGNAICGIWNGYSQDTLIAGNELAQNGEHGYGLERGGINIDSGRGNRIVHNHFRGNRCAIHLWWAPRSQFTAWASANAPDWEGNLITGNDFDGDALVFHFRGPGRVVVGPNARRDVPADDQIDAETVVIRSDEPGPATPPFPAALGETRPVGARPQWRGREHIVMTEWGPWDHASPLVRAASASGGRRAYELYLGAGRPAVVLEAVDVAGELARRPEPPGGWLYTLVGTKPGLHPFRFRVWADHFEHTETGTLLVACWDVVEFRPTCDAVGDLEGWRREADGPTAVRSQADALALRRSGTAAARLATNAPAAAQPASDPTTTAPADTADARGSRSRRRPRMPMGLIARTRVPMPAGAWEFEVLSAGGVRLLTDGEPVLESWRLQRGARRHTGRLDLATPREVELVVEQFRDGPGLLLTLEVRAASDDPQHADRE